MFFAKFAAGHPADECPDNDQHNVDAADSIVATIPVALTAHEDAAYTYRPQNKSKEEPRGAFSTQSWKPRMINR